MRVLVYIPQGRMVTPSLHSVCALDTSGYEATLMFDREHNLGNGEHGWQMGTAAFNDWYQRALMKMQKARRLALSGGYDALLSIEDDIIVPPDALTMLDSAEADVAYGLAVWRNAPHKWSATLDMQWGNHVTTLDETPEGLAAWGGVVDTLGCGLFCTLIRRPVLEAFDFRRVEQSAADWGLAFDARDAGFRQVTHTGVVCGHVDGNRILWPHPERRYRVTELEA